MFLLTAVLTLVYSGSLKIFHDQAIEYFESKFSFQAKIDYISYIEMGGSVMPYSYKTLRRKTINFLVLRNFNENSSVTVPWVTFSALLQPQVGCILETILTVKLLKFFGKVLHVCHCKECRN